MAPTHEDVVPEQTAPVVTPTDLRNFSDTDLVALYVHGDDEQKKNVTDEIIIRYDSKISHWIVSLLGSDFPKSGEAASLIGLKVFEKLFFGLLADAEGVKNFKGWLYTVTENETISWIRHRNAQKNTYNTQSEEQTFSASTPITEDEGKCIGDLLDGGDYDPIDRIARDSEFNQILSDVEELSNRQRLAIKVTVMFDNPLTDETIAEIASIRNVSMDTVRGEIAGIIRNLLKKHEKRDKHYESLANLCGKVRKLEAKLYYLRKADVPNVEAINKVTNQIQNKNGIRAKKLTEHQRFISPTAEEMRQLLGKDFGTSENINTLVCRARNFLKSRFAERLVDQDPD